MRVSTKLTRLLAVLFAIALLAAACGDDDDSGDDAAAPDTGDGTDEPADEGEGAEGGELVDLGTFVGGPPEHLDPALNTTLDAFQVIDLLYDGLTEISFEDPDNPEVVGLVAESFEGSEDAITWTFQIAEDVTFSDGTPVLPSSFVRGWERASDPDFAGDYSYLFNFIEGGAEKLDGTAETLSGVEADDEAMTLTTTLSEPYSNWPAVAGFMLFMPMPEAVEELSDQADWENGLMIGNGPYKMAEERSDQSVVLERNEEWAGDYVNDRAKIDRITFGVSADPESAYNAFEAGEGDTANIPPGRVEDAEANYGTTLDAGVLGSYHYEIAWTDPVVGGPENVELRKAISLAINDDEINEAVYDNTREVSTGITPPGIPGFQETLCEFCTFDQAAAQEAFDAWTADGNSLDAPIRIQFNAGAGHEDVVQISIDNLAQIGIEAVAEPLDTETYFSQIAEGACQICRSGWFADYPTYDNFMYDLFHSDAVGGNNHGAYSNPEFDALVDEAKATVDTEAAGELFRQAEDILLNQDIAVIPFNWYKGDYVFNDDKLQGFEQNPLGLVPYDEITISE